MSLALMIGAAGALPTVVMPVSTAHAAPQDKAAPPMPQAVLEVPAGQGAAQGVARRIRVEVAATDAARARGLMFRRELADDAGMLFVWRTPRRVAMWMKNTLIALDMVFIGADGCIVRVHSGAKPGDLTPIPSGKPVLAVLEVKAGMSQRLGLHAGTCLQLPETASAGRGTLSGSAGGDR